MDAAMRAGRETEGGIVHSKAQEHESSSSLSVQGGFQKTIT